MGGYGTKIEGELRLRRSQRVYVTGNQRVYVSVDTATAARRRVRQRGGGADKEAHNYSNKEAHNNSSNASTRADKEAHYNKQ